MANENTAERKMAETNGMLEGDISRWVDSRFLNFQLAEIKKDCLGFPLGFELGKYVDPDYEPRTFLQQAYQDGSALFRGRFEGALRKNLEQRMKNSDIKRKDNREYIFYGESLIGWVDINPLADILENLTSPQYDFDFKNPLYNNKPLANLYVQAVQMLSLLSKVDLDRKFWDRFLDDNRVNGDVIGPRSFTPIEKVRRIIQHYDRLEPTVASNIATHIFTFYIIPDFKDKKNLSYKEKERRKEDIKKEIPENSKSPQICKSLLEKLTDCFNRYAK